MEIKWKKTLLISLGIFVLIIGGVLAYSKMTNQSALDLLPSQLKGMILQAGENLTKEDYYTTSNIKTTGSYEFTLKNPEGINLSFDELKNKTKSSEEIPLDFNITILKGGFSSDKFYEIQNVSVPKYITNQNGTNNLTYLQVIDFNKSHLEIFFGSITNNYSLFTLKSDIISWDNSTNNIIFTKYQRVENGTKLVEKRVEISLGEIQKISLSPGEERKLIREIKPQISPLVNGGWGYSIFTNPWFNTTFDKRINITFDNTASSENLTNFTVLVVLNSSRISYSDTLDAGEDIRFIDDDESTILSHEIEKWNETGDSFIWVKVPLLENTATDFIQMYYNNQSVVNDGQDNQGSWDENYTTVWHLSEDPAGTPPQAIDKASFGRNGTTAGSMTLGDLQPRVVADGWDFDGSNDEVATPTYSPTLLETYELIMSHNPPAATDDFFRQQNSLDPLINLRKVTANNLQISENWDGGGADVSTFQTNNTVDTSYVHLTLTSNRTTLTSDRIFYINGSAIPSFLEESASGSNFLTGTAPLELANSRLTGWVGEFRISNVIRSPDWISASFISANDNLNTYSTSETFSVADSCTYTSGDWEVVCSDECNITSNVVGDGSDLVLSGTGNFNVEANITNFQEVHKDNACFVIKSNDAQMDLVN